METDSFQNSDKNVLVSESIETTKPIKAINRESVHRICSGQVVISLAIAVKELIENAIDAGATIIDIRLKEYGSENIEVSDNGSGITQNNFQALTLKHYTSKIQEFSDLETVTTLGFRGEALSSLCALTDVSILTRHTSAENATKIIYDKSGKIITERLAAREPGTTVTLQNLFHTLPVRRKEFLKNLKREFNKMCILLHAYCLVSKKIKFSCINSLKTGSKNTVVITEGFNTVRENIINVFTSKQISSLIDVELIHPDTTILSEYSIEMNETETLPFSFEFLISSVIHGSGRSTADRQFYYINSRPCEPKKIIRLVNEIYKQFNPNQSPFVFLNITSGGSMVDVNITPDKRQIFIEKERILLATLKASLLEAFKNFPSSYSISNLELSQSSTSSSKQRGGLKRSNTDSNLKQLSILQKFGKRAKTESDKDLETNSFHDSDEVKIICRSSKNTERILDVLEQTTLPSLLEKFGERTEIENDAIVEKEVKITCRRSKSPEKIIDVELAKTEDLVEKRTVSYCELANTNTSIEICQVSNTETKKPSIKVQIKQNKNEVNDRDLRIHFDKPTQNTSDRKSVFLNVCLDTIKEASLNKSAKNSKTHDTMVRFHSRIAPEENSTAEDELRKQISKNDFLNMTILGQFNLGFIITRLRDDLFIIDQHATDEKYNFEQLQENTILEKQVLVNAKPLELTAGNECLLMENEDIFNKNGFTFQIDQFAPCTKKVLLTSIPMSKSYVFGKDDIDEMLFMLQDSNHTMCRPSRIRSMFASRACRKSIMIGKALSKNDMRKLVEHMADIKQPWNCPHGRPTMRHLVNLDLIEEVDI